MVAFCLLTPFSANAETVERVLNGNTFTIPGKQMVSLWGVTAQKPGQRLGDKAKAHLSGLIAGQNVKLDCIEGPPKHRHCFVFHNGKDIAAEMVLAGLAVDNYRESGGLYSGCQRCAKLKKLGLWSVSGQSLKP